MKTFIAATALIALAGCGEGEPEARDLSANEVAAELASVRLEPGLWEQNAEIVDVSAPNLPVEAERMMKARGATVVRNCITPEQAERPDANFLAAQEGSDCTYQEFSMKNGRLKGTMTCAGGDMPGEMQTRMEGEYGTESYDMRMTMATSGMPEGADMTIVTRVSGRRVGACPAGGGEAE